MFTQRERLTKVEAAQINPVTLAFVGDAVYSLYVRERLATTSKAKVSQMQKVAAKIVSARGQSAFLEKLFPLLTEEESDVFRRAKNAKKGAKSKSASGLEYDRSTGLEAVFGFLYLTGEEDRIKKLLSCAEETDFEVEEEIRPFKPIR